MTDTRTSIIDAALLLMAERGFSGVSMKAVAEAAGIARQTLYNHFPDVDSIVAQALEAHQVEVLESLRSVILTIESPAGRLEHLIRQTAAAAAQHHPAVGIQHGLSAEAQATLQRHDAEFLDVIEDILRAGVGTGVFRSDLDIGRDAQIIRRMLDAVAGIVSADPHGLHATIAAATRTLLASVAAAGAKPS